MHINRFNSLALLMLAMLSGCSSPPQNASLAAAHSSYNSARSNPAVGNQAELELKEAGDSLAKADKVLNDDGSEADVNHLAYLAQQQVGIAEQTASRKTAETAVSMAGAQRDAVRLDARTAEADAANKKVILAHEKADQQATELVVAGVNAEHDKELIAQQELLIKELNAKKTERGLVITLADVLFNTNKAQLKPGGLRKVERLSAFLAQYPQYKVAVEGHTDSRASNDYNQDLSERRANSVRVALIDMAISGDRISMRGYGEEYPVASNTSKTGRQLNRRVEIILSDGNGNIVQR